MQEGTLFLLLFAGGLLLKRQHVPRVFCSWLRFLLVYTLSFFASIHPSVQSISIALSVFISVCVQRRTTCGFSSDESTRCLCDIHKYTWMYINIHNYTQIYIFNCVCTCIYVCAHTYTCIFLPLEPTIPVCMYVCAHTYIYIYLPLTPALRVSSSYTTHTNESGARPASSR